MAAWFEDEDFWAATYPILFPEERFVVAEEQVEKIQLSIYSGQELKDLLVRAEFAEVTLFGDLDGSRYGPHADRLIALGRKAA
jgi:hypothetical protein